MNIVACFHTASATAFIQVDSDVAWHICIRLGAISALVAGLFAAGASDRLAEILTLLLK
jgi:hypothetical protein